MVKDRNRPCAKGQIKPTQKETNIGSRNRGKTR